MPLTIKTSSDKEVKYENKVKLASIRSVSDIIPNLPSTRYYGSKKKLLPWLYENIKTLKFNTVLDGFGGTGSVSLLFKAMGKDVTYHDAFTFNCEMVEAVLANKPEVQQDEFYDFLKAVTPYEGVVYENFKNIYYTEDENKWIDGFIKKLNSSNLDKKKSAVYKYTFFQACLKKRPFNSFHRANLNIRLKENVNRSFGNKTTWERSFEELMLQSYQELSSKLFDSRSNIRISSATSINQLGPGYDLVYFDPPYVSLLEKNNTDDYWRRYHFLEGLCRYDDWAESIDQETKIKSLQQPSHFTEWSRKTTFREQLFKLVEKHSQSTVVLSYVSGAFPDEVEITAHFESLFPIVSVHSKDHSHALCKNRKRELLFIGRHQ